MRIYIPSSGRWGRQDTLRSLPEELHEDTTLVVPPDEAEKYRSSFAVPSGVAVVWPDIPKGVGHARQWCCDQEESRVLMLDDDLVFAMRREDDKSKFVDATPREIHTALNDLWNTLNIVPSVGMSTREGGNRYTERYDYDTRLLRVLGYNTEIMRMNDIRFDQIDVMEDFYVSLSLLYKGWGNIKLNWMVHNQGGSNSAGGCSQYRTPDVQADSARKLADLFPEVVTVVEKTTKTAWGGGTRTDVRIQWKKALEIGKQQRAAQ